MFFKARLIIWDRYLIYIFLAIGAALLVLEHPYLGISAFLLLLIYLVLILNNNYFYYMSDLELIVKKDFSIKRLNYDQIVSVNLKKHSLLPLSVTVNYQLNNKDKSIDVYPKNPQEFLSQITKVSNKKGSDLD